MTGLPLFKDGTDLKATDPLTGRTSPTRDERRRELRQGAVRLQEQARQAVAERLRADEQGRQAEPSLAEVERLRRESAELRKQRAGGE